MKLAEARAWLEIEGMSVPNGGRKRVLCPYCSGGTSKEISFVIRRDNSNLRGSCWRGSCSKWVSTQDIEGAKSKDVSTFKPREYWAETTTPPIKLYKWLEKEYNISREELELERMVYSGANGRMVFPVYDVHGKQYGYNTKRTCQCTDKYPKWMTFFDRDTTRLHYPRGVKKRFKYEYIFIVEDILSAIRIAQFAPVVALQGTSMSFAQAAELHRQTGTIILALDNDLGGIMATRKIKDRFGSVFENVASVTLACDPKAYKFNSELKTDLGVF